VGARVLNVRTREHLLFRLNLDGVFLDEVADNVEDLVRNQLFAFHGLKPAQL